MRFRNVAGAVTIAVCGSLVVSAAAVADVPPPDVVGTSCLISNSSDATTASAAVGSAVVFRLKCNWSPYDTSRPHAGWYPALRPFDNNGCASTTVCDDFTPTMLWFQEYTGTPSSSDLTVRHGAATRGVICNVTAFTVVDGPIPADATSGEWSWRCSSWTNWFGANNVTLDNATLLFGSSGSPSQAIGSGVAIGGGADSDLTPGTGTSWSGSLDWVTAAGFDAADPLYDWSVDPAAGCERLSFTGPSGSTVWRKGAPLTFTVSWTEGNAPAMLWLRFPLSGLLSQYADGTTVTFGSGPVNVPAGFVPYATPGVSNVSDPVDGEWTFDGTESITIDQLGPDARASDLLIMCIFNDSEGVEYGFHPWSGSSVSDVPPLRQCSLLGIARPAAAIDGEFTVLFHAAIASGSSDVGPVTVDRWDGADWVNVFEDQTFGGDDPPVPYVMDSLGQGVEELRFRCTDADGVLEGGRITGGPGYVAIVVGDDGFCDVGDVGLNPSSWLPAGGRLLGCVARSLFVPSDESLNRLQASADELTERAPVSFLSETLPLVSGSMSGAASAIEANGAGCLTLMPAGLLDGLGAQSACPSTVDSSGLSTVRTLIGSAFWIGAAWSLFLITRKLVMS